VVWDIVSSQEYLEQSFSEIDFDVFWYKSTTCEYNVCDICDSYKNLLTKYD